MDLNNKHKTKARWVVAFLMWLAISINYLDRASLSVAAPTITEKFHISPGLMGIILSAFFWSYTLFQIPSGWFADKVGHRISLAVSATWWSIATVAMAFTKGVPSLIATRLFMGVGEAGAHPSSVGVTARWFPDKERGRVAAIFDSGTKVGSALAAPLIAWMLLKFSWQTPFMVCGLLGVIWAAIWWFYYRSPEKHKYVNKAELEYIRKGQVKHDGIDNTPPVKWYKLLKHRNIVFMAAGYFCLLYAFYFFLTWLPSYLVKERGMDLLKMGFVAMIPPFSGLVFELFGGWLMDFLRIKGVSLTKARKINLVIGMLLATTIAFVGITSSSVIAVILLCISFGGTQFAAAAAWALPGDIAPKNSTSTVGSIQNLFGNTAGIIAPIFTGFIVAQTNSFFIPLTVAGIVTLIGAIFYLFGLKNLEPIVVEESASGESNRILGA